MSEQRQGGEAQQGVPADVLVPVVEGGVGSSSVEAVSPPEAVTETPFTLRRETGEKISKIFASMREEGDSDDELTKLEERFREGLRAEEEASRVVVEGLRQEAKELAESNNQGLEMLQTKRTTLTRLEELKQKTDAELETKKAHLEKAHAALIKLGEQGGTAEEIEAVMAEIDPEAAEKLVAARHELREPKAVEPGEPESERTTRMVKVTAAEAPAEPTEIVEPVAGEAGQAEERTQPYDVRTEFGQSGDVDQGSVIGDAAPGEAALQGGQPGEPQYVTRMRTTFGVDPAQLAQHTWPPEQ